MLCDAARASGDENTFWDVINSSQGTIGELSQTAMAMFWSTQAGTTAEMGMSAAGVTSQSSANQASNVATTAATESQRSTQTSDPLANTPGDQVAQQTTGNNALNGALLSKESTNDAANSGTSETKLAQNDEARDPLEEKLEEDQIARFKEDDRKPDADAAGDTSAPLKVDQIVLGRYPDYLQYAKLVGGRVFDIPLDVWDKMSTSEQDAANLAFLDRAIANNAIIRLSNSPWEAKPNSAFWKEVDYLAQRGFVYNARDMQMERPPSQTYFEPRP